MSERYEHLIATGLQAPSIAAACRSGPVEVPTHFRRSPLGVTAGRQAPLPARQAG